MHILVTGGAGYVGSHLLRALLDAGHTAVVVDDLSSGHAESLPEDVTLHAGSCGDASVLDAAAAAQLPEVVMHLAAKCSVDEAVRHPDRYYRANVDDGLALLDWMAARGVKLIVHSSTCAVYGAPDVDAIDEGICPRPVNPYGASKLALDLALRAYESSHGVRGVALRYFNAAGAHPDGTLGEDKTPATNLIPILFDVALGLREAVVVFGTDYATADGTGVRDYIHVMDLAAAHLAALDYLVAGNPGDVFNLGTGAGHSVREVVALARSITGEAIVSSDGARRPGDPPRLVADPGRAAEWLDWRARAGIDEIVADAWRWRARHPRGYRRRPVS